MIATNAVESKRTHLINLWILVDKIYDSCREVKMYSDDDYYEEEYSGYGHTGDPNLDRWDLRKFLAEE